VSSWLFKKNYMEMLGQQNIIDITDVYFTLHELTFCTVSPFIKHRSTQNLSVF